MDSAVPYGFDASLCNFNVLIVPLSITECPKIAINIISLKKRVGLYLLFVPYRVVFFRLIKKHSLSLLDSS